MRMGVKKIKHVHSQCDAMQDQLVYNIPTAKLLQPFVILAQTAVHRQCAVAKSIDSSEILARNVKQL